MELLCTMTGLYLMLLFISNYNATELPGLNATDYDHEITADQDGNYIFKELKKGDYYVF
ncbi:MAG: hypothetical protein IH946_07480, partial [Bacteroidetes bacterium]|nr:hypothetical protein [Bacteroidota bacterium]